MTTATVTPTKARVTPAHAVKDMWIITKRNLRRFIRMPQLLLVATVQPVMFLLLFNYVFGGAISIPGVPYIDFLLPGILVQTVMFGATNTATGLTEDLAAGVIDRFRSLPMARGAVLAGRTLADLLRSAAVNTLMVFVGYLIGFRPSGDPPTPAWLGPCAPVRVLDVVGVRRCGADRPHSGGGTIGEFPARLPVRVREFRVRPGAVDAQLAPGFRREPAGFGACDNRPRSHDRHRGDAVGQDDRRHDRPLDRLDHRHLHCRLAARGEHLPAHLQLSVSGRRSQGTVTGRRRHVTQW